MTSRKICYACDLADNPKLIEQYKKYHEAVWPEITKSIKDAGIIDMEIYIVANRLFMIMEVDKTYTPERKQKMDATNPKVQEWEKLMWQFQQAPPSAKAGEKWIEMEQIYKLP
ncbi:L-rhamnose mutarotase [Flavobacterium cellulosilyticum]|uniref:L-rhamnose mutarotase n=1 Tax=Flavobacterium cellulosilyticum TaxID=2541731 RepID=A0A4R5CKG6_9FLAO|nr:L-rhamnose mutarotase [Flavobacterium cellulosilyticum]TDD99669.1 L-rhamnose mutarotase [Flavobacterium cellulosilyticum]